MKLTEGYIPMFDAGHGGMIGGNYTTPGKRSPNWCNGVLYEGMFNRWIVNKIIYRLDMEGIPYFHVSPEYYDVPLSTRVRRANKIYRDTGGKSYLFSVHSNAGGGTGFEAFTSVGQTMSDLVATSFLEAIEEEFCYEFKMRFDYFSDGDKDKERNYDILYKTVCPALLVELLFMDSKNDYMFLWSEKFHNRISRVLADRIAYIYRHGIGNES